MNIILGIILSLLLAHNSFARDVKQHNRLKDVASLNELNKKFLFNREEIFLPHKIVEKRYLTMNHFKKEGIFENQKRMHEKKIKLKLPNRKKIQKEKSLHDKLLKDLMKNYFRKTFAANRNIILN